MATPDFKVKFSGFQTGLAPMSHLDKYTFLGDEGQAVEMTDVDVISQPGVLKQGPGLSQLTNTSVVDEKIQFIMDKSIRNGESYAIGPSELFKLTPGTVVDDTDFPRTITDSVEGESVINMNGNLFYFYNKSSEGDIGTYNSFSTFNDTWGSSTDLPLQDAPHPSAVKEDILAFGNGRYVGTYIEGLGMLDTKKLDFGSETQVADIIYHAGYWYIAVNSGDADSYRTNCEIFMWDGSGMSDVLADEAGVGVQKIGFLYPHNGVVYVAYEDISSDGHIIGYLSGRKLKPLRYFDGQLPNHKEKSLYKNTILFANSPDIYSAGASVSQVENQISSIASGRYNNIGGIAAPFGTPLVASSDGSSNHSLDKFNNLSTDTTWTSVSSNVMNGSQKAQIDSLIVRTKPLGANARCDIRLVGNQGQKTSNWKEISGEDKIRHVKDMGNLNEVNDIQLEVKWENGDTSSNCPIRDILALGHYVSR